MIALLFVIAFAAFMLGAWRGDKAGRVRGYDAGWREGVAETLDAVERRLRSDDLVDH